MIVLSGTVTIAPLRKSTRSVLNLYQTWEEVFQVIYQTREGAFHLISKHGKVRYQTREGVFHLISKHREVRYQTREGAFHLISKYREVIYQTRDRECFIWYSNIDKWVKKTLVFRAELRTSWRSMFLKLLSYEAQKCLVVRRFKIPVKGWAEAFLAKFCAPIWCAEVTCRSSVLQVDTCSATLQKITSFLRKLLLYFRWYRLGRRLQFII